MMVLRASTRNQKQEVKKEIGTNKQEDTEGAGSCETEDSWARWTPKEKSLAKPDSGNQLLWQCPENM